MTRKDDEEGFDPKSLRTRGVPLWMISSAVPIIFMAITWVWKISPVVADAQEQKEYNKIFFSRIDENGALSRKHDAVIPLMQTDIRDIKEGQRDMNKKIDQILMAVRS